MILIDTSIWIDHIHQPNPILIDLLQNDRVLMHPFVIGEIALGNFRSRTAVLANLADLPPAPMARSDEVLTLIDAYTLQGAGIGYVDVNLIASTLLFPGAQLYSRDRRLVMAADRLGVGFNPA